MDTNYTFDNITNKHIFVLCGAVWQISASLGHIVKQIVESKCLLNYKDDWNEDGAEATNEKTFVAAISFLVLYAEKLCDADTIIESPYIDILLDGSISVQWNTTKGVFHIIFKKNNDNAYFYARQNDTGFEIKGFIDKNKILSTDKTEDVLIFWFKKYLVKQ